MTEYKASLKDSLSFEIRKGNELVGRLLYGNWFRFDAKMEITGKGTYSVEPKGFWESAIELKDGKYVLLSFSMNWSGNIVMQTFFNDLRKGFILRHKGVFRESYVLVDEDDTELIIIKPEMKWSKMNYEYQLTATDQFEKYPDKAFLLLTCIHCANYYVAISSGSMA